MDAPYAHKRSFSISAPTAVRPSGLFGPLVAAASKLNRMVASVDIAVGRKTTIVPGLSDNAIARLAKGPHHEDAMRWNATAHQYGGTPIKS